MGQDILVEDNQTKKIGKGLKAGDDATVSDGGERTLMPGIIPVIIKDRKIYKNAPLENRNHKFIKEKNNG
jgi:dihydroorotase-like cyclic amidohydrolase